MVIAVYLRFGGFLGVVVMGKLYQYCLLMSST